MRAVTDCDRALQLPVIALGCAALLLSIVGLVGSCGRRAFTRPFLWAYVATMFVLTVAAFALTVFAFVVTTNRGGGGGFRGEYRLGDFSGWLQVRVAQPDTWRRVESCLAEARVCGGRFEGRDVGPLAVDFYRRHLSPIQSGCCKPPTRCGFRLVNATSWETPGPGGMSPVAAGDGDCRAWSNDQRVLCFECDACKAGVLATVNKKWKVVAVFNVVLLVVLVVYTLGCCALRSHGGKKYHDGCGAEQT
ncbi:hypothetical protein PR202_gb17227 [Eleusine coracana subsp. coracana]|uniref:Senescence-associated protein n=1 Tax=Eleusine coracana subsp. coracana TaxID=191504 RepID=A0AAV5F2F1_ELECO|nr:hypothetical protein PR202_gb17227 [Eleusine coracana subsp. coracana]